MAAPGPRELVHSVFAAGVAAAQPGPAVRRALRESPVPRSPVHIIALGKAALPMARAALDRLQALGDEPAGGLVVCADPGSYGSAPPHASIPLLAGDHPVPGAASGRASAALERITRHVASDDECWVLLSGGTSSLIGAPAAGVGASDLAELFQALLHSGLDIAAANRVRKRFLRWGAGRLAGALAPARVRVLIASDVRGDHPRVIASGPCAPDDDLPSDVVPVLEMLAARSLVALPTVERLIGWLPHAAAPLAAGHPAFAHVETRIVVRIGDAVAGAVEHGRRIGLDITAAPALLTGEARTAGEALVRTVLSGTRESARCTIHGGETTVTIDGAPVPGGRCQELALAAARALSGTTGITLLACGTDGRDGPTDAAGAIVDGQTWAAIRAAGRDPEADLTAHRSHAALEAAAALVRTGPTGTNVGDLVVLLEG